MKMKTQGYINGRWVAAKSGREFDVLNPANGEKIASVANMGREDTLEAVAAAHAAFDGWKSKTSKERSIRVRAWYELILQHADALAMLMTSEQGKPLAEAKGEVIYGASFVEWFAEEVKRSYGDVIPSPAPGRKLLVFKEPIGVAAAITPWNFPLAMITRKCAPSAWCSARTLESKKYPSRGQLR